MHTVFDQTGIITGTQRFSINDGPGIRTLVFFKGCPLQCLWCHNPETQLPQAEILYEEQKCIGCGACADVCPQCHAFCQGRHVFSRDACTCCGRCTEVCPSALDKSGTTVTVDDVMNIVRADKPFYRSLGGLTLSGGEPFAQGAFALALLRAAKAEGYHCAVETCGAVKTEVLLEAAPYVDLFLYDVKEMDADRHKRLTGMDNALIQKNLQVLSEAGAAIVLRVPVVPQANDGFENLRRIGLLASRLDGVTHVEVLPYHRAGNHKYAKLGRNADEFSVPTEADCRRYLQTIQEYTDKNVKRG